MSTLTQKISNLRAVALNHTRADCVANAMALVFPNQSASRP